MRTNPEASATSTSRLQPFHSDDTPALQDYRSLSVLAILSLAIGLLSPLCFIAPLMRTLPLIGIAVALLALRRISQSEGLLAGRAAALGGLALSVASLAAVIGYEQVERALRTNQAEQFAIRWLEVLASGNTEQAFRMSVAGTQPPPPPDAPGGPRGNPYDNFVADSLIQRVAAIGGQSQVRPGSVVAFGKQSAGSYFVQQQFTVTPDPDASSDVPSGEPLRVLLTVQRAKLPGERQLRWLVLRYQADNGDPSVANP
jgi:hypothetical protein